MRNLLKRIPFLVVALMLILPFPAAAQQGSATTKARINQNVKTMQDVIDYMTGSSVEGGTHGDDFDRKIPFGLKDAAFYWDNIWRNQIPRDPDEEKIAFHLATKDIRGIGQNDTVGVMNTRLKEQCSALTEVLVGKGGDTGFLNLVQNFESVSTSPDVTEQILDEILTASNLAVSTAHELIRGPNPCLFMIANILESLNEGTGDADDDLECLARKILPGGRVNYTRSFTNDEGVSFTSGSQVRTFAEFTDICDNCGDPVCTENKDRDLEWRDLPGCSGSNCAPEATTRNGYYAMLYGDNSATNDGRQINSHISAMQKKHDDLWKKIEPFKDLIKQNVKSLEETAKTELERGSVVSLSLPFSTTSPATYIGRIIQQAIGITGALALGFFVYGGFMYMTAAGNQERIGQAKRNMVWAALGLVVIFAAYAIVNFIITAVQ